MASSKTQPRNLAPLLALARGGEHGFEFIAYGESLDRFERVMRRTDCSQFRVPSTARIIGAHPARERSSNCAPSGSDCMMQLSHYTAAPLEDS